MIRTFDYIIEGADSGMTIQDFLKSKGYSHNIIVALKKTCEGIIRNDHWAYVSERLQPQDRLHITLAEETSSEHILPVYHPLTIVYEDADLLVVDKPADMPVHPSMNHYEHTLANAVAYYYDAQNIPFTFRCVNRLDRDTSGLTIIAKHMLSSHLLSKQIQARTLHREYLAIASGITPVEGRIDAPIARVADSVICRCVDPIRGERAVTTYRTLAQRNDLSLLSLILETGRTHQIRVHMQHINHPLIGDFLYNPQDHQMERQALHSHRLTFRHPITDMPLEFTSPLPPDMACFFPEY